MPNFQMLGYEFPQSLDVRCEGLHLGLKWTILYPISRWQSQHLDSQCNSLQRLSYQCHSVESARGRGSFKHPQFNVVAAQ